MHGHNTYYHYHFNIMERDWDCKCSDATPPNPDSVCKHILHLCPLHDKECRSYLTPVSRLHKTMTLLSSDKGLLAMAKFLEMSGALMSDGKPYKKPEILMIPTEVNISNILDDESDK